MEPFQFSEQQRYERAKKKAKEIRDFYYHLVCYCVVIPTIVVINLAFVPEFHWFWFTIFGWGTGLVIHGINAFGFVPFLGKDWEERKIREIMEKQKQQNNQNKN